MHALTHEEFEQLKQLIWKLPDMVTGLNPMDHFVYKGSSRFLLMCIS